MHNSRRDFLKQSTLAAAGSTLPFASWTSSAQADVVTSPNARPKVAVVGNGNIAQSHGKNLRKMADLVANCDVDENRAAAYRQTHSDGKSVAYSDYRKLLERDDIDAVFVCTPEHWHVKVAADAMRAGKDVYCEKPLTLTIEEGRFLEKVVRDTGKVLQVGTQQRSDRKFQTAVALAQLGRIGKIKKVTVGIGTAPDGGPYKTSKPPASLNWDMWQGQTPAVDYIEQRCFWGFRWWYEYSAGKITDWGAHHVDIAQWAVAPDGIGPNKIEVLESHHPVEFKDGYPLVNDAYNTAISFNIRCTFPSGVEMYIHNNPQHLGFENGIMFEGEQGRYFVNRGKLTGKPVEDLKGDPISEDVYVKLRKGQAATNHRQNFFNCCNSRDTPISDVVSHNQHLTTCHLAGIALRLNRTLNWNHEKQTIVGDEQANAFQAREQRKGYEVV